MQLSGQFGGLVSPINVCLRQRDEGENFWINKTRGF